MTWTPVRVTESLLAWSAPHFGWTPDKSWPELVNSVALDAPGAPLVLIDPIASGDDFWRWLDERARARGGVVVLVANRFHGRNAPEVLARHPGTPVYAPGRVFGLVDVPVSHLVSDGTVVPGGIVARRLDGMEDPELGWHIPSERALYLADTVTGTGSGLELVPAAWCKDEASLATLVVPSLRRLLGLEPEHVIPSHGRFEPGHGVAKLRAALG